MSSPPELISVIVRTQNRPLLLREALASIVGQTYRPIEVIVVNDGGSDVNELVQSSLRDLDQRYVNHTVPYGRSAAANAGMRCATGQWIAFLDDDDLLLPIHIATLLRLATENDTAVAYAGCRLQRIDSNENEVFAVPFNRRELVLANTIPNCAVLAKREAILAVGGFDETLSFLEDWDLWLRLSEKHEFAFAPEVTSIYRVRPGSVGGEMELDRWQALVQLLSKHWHKVTPELLTQRLHRLERDIQSWRNRSLASETETTRLRRAEQAFVAFLGALPGRAGKHTRRAALASNLELPDRESLAAVDPPNPIGVWLAKVSKPYPKLAAALYYLRYPRRFVYKAIAVVRRRLAARTYDSYFKAGRFLADLPASDSSIFFSVATPVYRVAEEHLVAAISSVRAQTYRNWELILLDDASPDPHVRRVLAQAAREDERIKIVHRDSNSGIALATNQIVDMAKGEYVAFLDHDDMIHPRALELANRIIASHPDVDWVFSDEDKIDERGRHHEPCLKPGWSRHLLHTFNYVCHFRVVKRQAMIAAGGHRDGFDGAQDYDMALRMLSRGGSFAHLPGVLYHWRTVATSMARAAAAKPAAHTHAIRALSDYAAGFPRGGRISSEVLLAPASFFFLRRWAATDLPIAILGADSKQLSMVATGAHPISLIPTVSPLPSIEELQRICQNSREDVIVVPPQNGLSCEGLEELLALLNVPGTAIAAIRHVTGQTVTDSGWVVHEDDVAWDPWAGLDVHSPGYLNLAMVPAARLAPPAGGWVAWRESLLAALETARDISSDWRLAVGLHRFGQHTVVTPRYSSIAPAKVRNQPSHPPPQELPRQQSSWLEWVGSLEGQARIPAEEP